MIKIARFLFVICLMLLLSANAFAFGKNGKGVLGWRGQTQAQAQCTGCSAGQCATGNCATACSNGQCVEQKTITRDGKQYVQVCNGDTCTLVEVQSSVATSQVAIATKPVTKIEGKDGNVWATDGNVWKVK